MRGDDVKPKQPRDAQYEKRRKLFSILSIVLFLTVIILLTVLFTCVFSPYLRSSEELHRFLESFGWKGRFILFGLQCVQVVVAIIPGEIIELGAGYAYGAVEGTLICLAGVALSSAVIFSLTKKIGTPLVEAFISREKIQQLRFINSEKKLKRTIFWLFFIPGTPKDVLTYFVGLTDIRLSQFLTITLIARIPSVLSSTICGQFLGAQDYRTAAIVYAITGGVSLAGYCLYNKVIQLRQKRKTTAQPPQETDEP